MPVRVKVFIESILSNKRINTLALLNTGFTSEELDVHIPKNLAEKLSLWPPPQNSILEIMDTVGGNILSYVVPRSIRLKVVEDDRESKTLICNAVITLHEEEVLLSDAVIEELEIEILSPKTGYWRFKGEDKIRKSHI